MSLPFGYKYTKPKKKRAPKQFCPKKHDTFILGRDESGICSECRRERNRKDPSKDSRIKDVCVNGHDIIKCGRTKNGACKDCLAEYQKEYQERVKKGHKPKPKVQFCPKGHDTFKCGRRNNGRCLECCLIDDKISSISEILTTQFCSHGHDTFITGRNKKGNCIVCVPLLGKERDRKWREEHKEELAQANREWRKAHKERCRELSSKWKEEHAEEYKERTNKWRKENKEKINAKKNAYANEKLQNDINFRLSVRLRDRLRKAIKNNRKAGSAVKDLGCSIDFFKEYIEDQFYGDMTWSNWGTYWELDHIKELWEFDLTEPVQFKEAVHYTNFQPLTKPDHQKKSSIGKNKRLQIKKGKQHD